MASTYTGLGIEKMTTGENAGDWGTKTNTNLQIVEQIAGGYIEQAVSTTTTLSVSDGSVDAVLAHRIIKFTGTLSANSTVTIPLDVQQMYILLNGTGGAYTLTFKYVSGSGSTAAWAATDKGTKIVYATADDGTDPNMVDTGISSTGAHDLDGNELILDADADTSITADTDDQIDFKVGGTDRIRITTGALAPSSSDGAALGTTALEFSDLFLADGAVIKFGDDQEVTLTHVEDAGLLLNTTMYLTFRDSALKIHSSTDGQLDIDADTEVEITATTVDLNGILDVSGVIVAGGQISAADGSAGAPSISNTGDLDTGLLFSAANKMQFSSGGTAQVTFQDGAIVPVTDDDVDLGTASLQFKDVYIDGTLEADAITIGGSAVTAGAGAVTALNNATQSELVTVGSTTTELDAEANLTFTGSALTCIGTITTGVDGTGHDVKFFGDTASRYWLWDESADGVVQRGTLTVGVDDIGHDVKFFGATASAYMLWDESTDDLVLAGAANLYLYDAGGGEKLSSDGTDLTINSGNDINLTATTDINVPSGVGLTLGNDGEKIEGDGTDLTIASSGVLNLAAGGATNQVKVTDGAIVPIADDDVDLGTASYQFKNAYFDGTLEAAAAHK